MKKYLERRSDTSVSRTHVFNLVGAIIGAILAAMPYFQVYLPAEVYGLIMIVAAAINDYIRRTQRQV